MTSIKQIAALPYRYGPRGALEVLLITSRGTGRWVIPKGNPIRGMRSHIAAAKEAFEEAGITGVASPEPIGNYGYDKELRDGTSRAARVEVFPLAVGGRSATWPEQHQRESRWFSVGEAAAAVQEPELKAIIAGFRGPRAAVAPGRMARLQRWLREPWQKATSPAR